MCLPLVKGPKTDLWTDSLLEISKNLKTVMYHDQKGIYYLTNQSVRVRVVLTENELRTIERYEEGMYEFLLQPHINLICQLVSLTKQRTKHQQTEAHIGCLKKILKKFKTSVYAHVKGSERSVNLFLSSIQNSV